MADCFTDHLRECAVDVINGVEFFDETHPYCYDSEFILILIEELDKRRLHYEAQSKFEHCAAYRDAITDLHLVVKELNKKVASERYT